MILGGIRELHTDIISSKALDLLRSSDIKVHFVQEVPLYGIVITQAGVR